MEQDIKKLIEELTKVRPDELSTDGLKLFNKINEIIDKNKELEEENKEKQKTIETMRYIKAICRTQEDTYLLDKDMCAKKNKYMLEVENGAFVDANELYRIWKNSIPISLVEETIKELDKQEKQELKGLKRQDRYFVKQMYQHKRSVLQELLERWK